MFSSTGKGTGVISMKKVVRDLAICVVGVRKYHHDMFLLEYLHWQKNKAKPDLIFTEYFQGKTMYGAIKK